MIGRTLASLGKFCDARAARSKGRTFNHLGIFFASSAQRYFELRQDHENSLRCAIYSASSWGRMAERDGGMLPVFRQTEVCLKAIHLIEQKGGPHPFLAKFHIMLGHAATRKCERSGLKQDAREAIEWFDQATALLPSDQPLQEASCRAGLGTALVRLGEREEGDATLRRAVNELSQALALCTRDLDAISWASISNTLATALARLGERTGKPGHLHLACTHLRQALEVRQRATYPHAWAATVTDLGNVLVRLGEMTGEKHFFTAAIEQFDQALTVVTLKRSPRDYSETQNNRGYTLKMLYSVTGELPDLDKALTALQEAEKGAPRSEATLDWAVIQVGLADVLLLNGTPTALSQALKAVDSALEVLGEDLAPVTWHNARKLRAVILRTMDAATAPSSRAA